MFVFCTDQDLKNLVGDFFFNNWKKQGKGTFFRSFFLKSNSFMTFYGDFFGQRLFLIIDCLSISVYISQSDPLSFWKAENGII